jgi:hypothetical protein
MPITRARAVLVAIFLTGFVLQAIAVVYTFSKGEILSKEVLALLARLLAVYSVPLAVILGGVFGQHKGGLRRASGFAFWLAAVLAGIWNLLLMWRTIAFSLASEDSVPELSAYLETISSAGSFLVAGALAYFFTKREG